MQNWLSTDTDTFHIKGIFGAYLDYYRGGWFLKKWETGLEHWAIVYFVKRSEGYLVHTETVCLI